MAERILSALIGLTVAALIGPMLLAIVLAPFYN